MQPAWSERDSRSWSWSWQAIPISQLVDLATARVHDTSKSAHLSPGAPSPSVEGQWAPPPLGPAPKRACCASTSTMSVAPKEEKATVQEVPLPTGPSEAAAAPWEALSFWQCCQGDLPSPATSLNSHFPLDPSSEST